MKKKSLNQLKGRIAWEIAALKDRMAHSEMVLHYRRGLGIPEDETDERHHRILVAADQRLGKLRSLTSHRPLLKRLAADLKEASIYLRDSIRRHLGSTRNNADALRAELGI